MKRRPIDETWCAEDESVFLDAAEVAHFNGPRQSSGADDPSNVARARLAAQAPAMARLLRSLASRGEFETTSWLDIEDVERVQAVLRAAGVVEPQRDYYSCQDGPDAVPPCGVCDRCREP